jgi:hypothetical protein
MAQAQEKIAPYLMVGMRDAKLKAVLYKATEAMTQLHAKVEIEGTGGLTLRMSIEAVSPGWVYRPLVAIKESGKPQEGGEKPRGWMRGAEGQWARVHLRLEDKRGEQLVGVVSRDYPVAAIEDDNMVVGILERLVDKIVEGGNNHRALDVILDMRQMATRIKVRNARDAAARLPEMEQDLIDAETDFGWVEAVTTIEAPTI